MLEPPYCELVDEDEYEGLVEDDTPFDVEPQQALKTNAEAIIAAITDIFFDCFILCSFELQLLL